MLYLILYLLIGIVLLFIKSPSRECFRDITIYMHIDFISKGMVLTPFIELTIKSIFLFILVFFYPIIICFKLADFLAKKKAPEKEIVHRPISNISWLKREISVKDAEARYMVCIDGKNVPFGHVYVFWRKLMEVKREGDKLYEFCSPEDSWENLTGREGVALVRNGEIIADVMTRMN